MDAAYYPGKVRARAAGVHRQRNLALEQDMTLWIGTDVASTKPFPAKDVMKRSIVDDVVFRLTYVSRTQQESECPNSNPAGSAVP